MAKRFYLALTLVLLSSTLATAQEYNGEIVRSGIAAEVAQAEEVHAETVQAEPLNDSEYIADDESVTPLDKPAASEQDAPARFSPPVVSSSPTIALKSGKPRRLAPRSSSEKNSPGKSSLSNPAESLITVGGSLCVVLALFFGLAWMTRRGLPKNLGKLPGEVIEVLGKSPLTKGQELQLVRVGGKLLLICVSPGGCETLTEIVDHAEVDRLAAICRANGPSSMTAAFNQVLTGIGREPAVGFAGTVRTPADRRGGRTHA